MHLAWPSKNWHRHQLFYLVKLYCCTETFYLSSESYFQSACVLSQWIQRIWKLFLFRLQTFWDKKEVKSFLHEFFAQNFDIQYFRWVHYCVVLTGLDENSEFAKVQIWFQGRQKLTKEFKTTFDPQKDGKGILIVGQEQDSYGGGFDKFQSFSGKISQFNIFNR